MILNSRLSTEAGPQKTSSSNCMSIISYRTSIIYHISCTVLVLYCTALRWNLGKISSRFKSGLKPVQTPVDLYWYTDCIVITHDSSKGPPPPPPPTHPHHPTDDGMYSITGRYIKKKESKSNQPMLNRIRVRKATPVKGKFLLLLSFFFFISWWVCKKRSAEIGTPVPVCRCGDWWWWWRCDLFWSFFTSKCVISFYHQSQPIMSLKLIWEKKKKKKWSWEMFIWWSELLYVNIISPRFWAQDLACFFGISASDLTGVYLLYSQGGQRERSRRWIEKEVCRRMQVQ